MQLGKLIALGVTAVGIANTLSNYKWGNEVPTEKGGLYGPTAQSIAYNVFGGGNAALNFGAGIGLNWAGNKIIKSVVNNSNFTGTSGVLASGSLSRSITGATFSRKTSDLLSRAMSGAKLETDEISSILKTVGNGAIGSKRFNANMATYGATQGELTALKQGAGLKRLGSVAMWAPIFFSAFEGVAGLYEMSPQTPARPGKRSSGLGGTFMDTDMAYTQRRRALQAIHSSQYSGRAAFGNEASLMHG